MSRQQRRAAERAEAKARKARIKAAMMKQKVKGGSAILR